VLNTKISSPEEFENFPDTVRLSFLQMASLFESIGLLVERNYVKPELIDDMFATQQAWDSLSPFIMWMRKKYESEEYYYFFEKLHKRLAETSAT